MVGGFGVGDGATPAVLHKSNVGLYPPLPVAAIFVEYPYEFPNGSAIAVTAAVDGGAGNSMFGLNAM